MYVPHVMIGGKKENEDAVTAWRGSSRKLVALRRGKMNVGYKPLRQKKRVQTYLTMRQTSNILKQTTTRSTKYFQILPGADGKLPDPYGWPHLGMSTDRAAENVSADCFYGGPLKLNYTNDWDISRDVSNTVKNALKQSGLWKHVVRRLRLAMSATALHFLLRAFRNFVSFSQSTTRIMARVSQCLWKLLRRC